MNCDSILNSFLRQQQIEAAALAAESDIVDVQVIDNPPQHYIAHFNANGLVKVDGRVIEAKGCLVGIWLPDDYLRHADPAQILTYLGPHRHPWHPNILPPYLCVHLVPGTPLIDLLHICLDLWTWGLYYTGDDGLNRAASQWARQQDPNRFPIDRRPLKRRKLAIPLISSEPKQDGN